MDKYADIRSVKDFISRELSQEYADIIDRSINQCNNYINTHRSFINERVISGYHRDCHGDLNAHNIFLYDDPVIFDCIEFNDEFRYIDVLNDIAFLCVDLDYYGYSDYSELFYQRYLQSFELEDDRESRDLFNFYKSYRANIRAKVTALSAQEKTSSEKMKEDIKKYLNLMNDYFSG